jgi:hypothetical protein
MVYNPTAHSICSKSSLVNATTTRSIYQKPIGFFPSACLDVRAAKPGGGGQDAAYDVQIWAKPQPNGAVAVLVINALIDGMMLSFPPLSLSLSLSHPRLRITWVATKLS